MKKLVALFLLFVCIKAKSMDVYCNGAPTTVQANGGGNVAITALVDQSVYVGPNASVCENATVLGNTQINDQARIYGYAKITNGAIISGSAQVFGNAILISNESQIVKISDSASVFGNAKILDGANISGSAKIYENARVSENSSIGDFALVFGNATVEGSAQIKGTTRIHGSAVISRNILTVSGSSDICVVKHYPANTNLENINNCPAQPVLMSTSQISTGEAHTCIVLSKGKVRCWGNNTYGQLGSGDTVSVGDHSLPNSAKIFASNVKMLAAGNRHTCALLNTGAVKCWGTNAEGELGYGNTTTLLTAGEEIKLGGVATQITAGAYHTCALLSTGTIRCWGYNGYGQLGYGNASNIGDNEYPSVAGDVNLGGVATNISAGTNHTCAILSNGTVKCWGYNGYGQLGTGNNTNLSLPSSEINVGGTAIQVAAGLAHTCALLSNGTIKCWGANSEGELGLGNTTGQLGPGNAVDLGGTAKQISAGSYHTCALLTTGAVRCWGYNANGQLGLGVTLNVGDDETPSFIGDIKLGGTATQISLGAYFSCALLSTRANRCWGMNNSGQLGYGHTNNIGDDEIPSSVGDVVSQFIGKSKKSWGKYEF